MNLIHQSMSQCSGRPLHRQEEQVSIMPKPWRDVQELQAVIVHRGAHDVVILEPWTVGWTRWMGHVWLAGSELQDMEQT